MTPPPANRAAAALVMIGAAFASAAAPSSGAPSQTHDPEAQAAFRELVRATRARDPFQVRTSLVVEVTEGGQSSRSPPIDAVLRFDPKSAPPRAQLSLRGYEILVRDGRIDVRHASNEREYVSIDDEGSPRDALLAEFLDLPYPHLGIIFGGDDMDQVASRLAPRAARIVPTRVEHVDANDDALFVDWEGDAAGDPEGESAEGAASRAGARRRIHFTGDAEDLRLDVDPATNTITALRLEITGGPMVRDGASLRLLLRCDDSPLTGDEATEAFTFDPGPRRRIDSIAALPRATEGAGPGGAFAAGRGEASLVGRPAPELALAGLDGGSFDLAESLGRSVVVIDFWATWCAPCRVGLPKLDGVVRRLAERGVPVTAVAVNTLEGAAGEELLRKVGDFWRNKGYSMEVALDEDGEAAAAYGVSALPTTFVVGLDGIVHWRHAGLTATWERDLEAAIEAALKPFGSNADLQPIPERP